MAPRKKSQRARQRPAQPQQEDSVLHEAREFPGLYFSEPQVVRVESHDTRGVILGALAEAIISQNRAIECIAQAAISSPNHQSTENVTPVRV